MSAWSTRIPAAIEKGKKQLGDAAWTFLRFDVEEQVILTREELALAEALLDSTCSKFVLGTAEQTGMMYCQDGETCTRHRALRAFTEKIESL